MPMNDVTHSVSVRIAGETHVLRSAVPAERTREVASYINATIQRMGLPPTLEPHRAVLLAALTITDELLRAREEAQLRDEEGADRLIRIAARLERLADAEANAGE